MQSKCSPQMRAVLSIITADPFLFDMVGPFIDINNDSIDWDKIFSCSLSSGYLLACNWAYGIWTDNIRDEKINIFESSSGMDGNLKAGVLRALKMRWNL